MKRLRFVANYDNWWGQTYKPGDLLELGDEQLEKMAQSLENQGYAIEIPEKFECKRCNRQYRENPTTCLDCKSTTFLELNTGKTLEMQEKDKKGMRQPFTLSEVFHWKKDKNFVVQDFLLPKTVNMMFSPPSGYKSLLTLDMCICIAAGEPWLGLKTKKSKVLILDRENSNKDIRDRVVSLVNGHGWRKKLRGIKLNLLIRNGMLTDDKFLTDLHEYVQEEDIRLVVIDTLRRFSSFEENSSDDMNKLYAAFQKIINGSNAAIHFLHHTNKDETSYRGSVDLLGQVDTAYRISRSKKDTEFRIICEKSRSGEIDEIQGSIEWDKEKEITIINRHDIEEKEENDRYAKFKACRTWVLNVVEKVCPMVSNKFLRKSMIKELESENVDKTKENRYSPRLLDQVLEHLVKTKYLAKTGEKGEYRRLFSSESGILKAQMGINT